MRDKIFKLSPIYASDLSDSLNKLMFTQTSMPFSTFKYIFLRCLSDDLCKGYQYKYQRTGLGKCVLIHNDGMGNFQSSSSAVTYKKGKNYINDTLSTISFYISDFVVK